MPNYRQEALRIGNRLEKSSDKYLVSDADSCILKILGCNEISGRYCNNVRIRRDCHLSNRYIGSVVGWMQIPRIANTIHPSCATALSVNKKIYFLILKITGNVFSSDEIPVRPEALL